MRTEAALSRPEIGVSELVQFAPLVLRGTRGREEEPPGREKLREVRRGVSAAVG